MKIHFTILVAKFIFYQFEGKMEKILCYAIDFIYIDLSWKVLQVNIWAFFKRSSLSKLFKIYVSVCYWYFLRIFNSNVSLGSFYFAVNIFSSNLVYVNKNLYWAICNDLTTITTFRDDTEISRKVILLLWDPYSFCQSLACLLY